MRAVGTPAIEQLSLHIDDASLLSTAPQGKSVSTDFTPRRSYLDRILVDAAIAAGTEVRDHFTVKELVWSQDRVIGIKGAQRGGQTVTELAKIVIGADGARSTVAEAVSAEKYIDAGTHTCAHYAYYSGVTEQNNLANVYFLTNPQRFYITFPTNDDLHLVLLFWPAAMAKTVGGDVASAYAESLHLIPDLEAQVASGHRETRITGTHLLPNYFRRGHGPGWALVGDALMHRDPISAQGITNALTHASMLAEELTAALQQGHNLDMAARTYDHRQFIALKPMFDYTVHLAKLQPLSTEVKQMIPQVTNDPLATSAFVGAFMGSAPWIKSFPHVHWNAQ